MRPVRLEPAAPMSQVKHSTTEQLCFQRRSDVFSKKAIIFRGSRGGPTFSGGGGGGIGDGGQLFPGGWGPSPIFHRNLSKLGFS